MSRINSAPWSTDKSQIHEKFKEKQTQQFWKQHISQCFRVQYKNKLSSSQKHKLMEFSVKKQFTNNLENNM
jgi:hypothetical protein